jgi:peptide deformylase
MAVRPILRYGDPRLVAPNAPVERFDGALRALVRDLFETGWAAPGLGVAAPQVGANLQLAVVDLSVGRDPAARTVLANPELVAHAGRANLEEGCLSFPGLFTTVKRPRSVRVRAQDAAGRWRTISADGVLAQALCHELDHLAGVLLVDHLRGLRLRAFERKIARARKTALWQQVPA